MTVCGDPMDPFGLSASIARCVSPLTEGAQTTTSARKRTSIELIESGDAG
jgi:hypothetical protein